MKFKILIFTCVMCALMANGVVAKANLTNIFFLHHSTGNGLVEGGNMREVFNEYNAEHGTKFVFWDHGYNGDGLRSPAGESTELNYDIPNDNTDPDGLYVLWTTNNSARAKIMKNHQVIAFKSCFPASNIEDAARLAQYKKWYLAMRKFFDKHPEKLFVVMSPPPLCVNETDARAAKNARAFANWLKGDYVKGHSNLVCFDLFDQLAGSNNMLRANYWDGGDSHPNALANETVGPVFARFLINAAENY